MTLALLLAWLLPLAAGSAAWLALNPVRGPGWVASTLGYGIVFGLLLAAGATALFAHANTAHALLHAAPWLAVFAGAAGIVAWRRARGLPRRSAVAHSQIMNKGTAAQATTLGISRESGARNPHVLACTFRFLCSVFARPAFARYARAAVPKWKIALLAAAVLSLAWRGWIALREILLRPTFPWDAWDAWAVKSKTWFLLGHYAPFVSMHDWLLHPTTAEYTGPAWSYPAALGWIQIWFASAAGGWIEPLINLPWFALWLGLLLGHYGQWRALGLSRMRAIVFVYVLGSLPLVITHVALAGYADLWIATVFGLGVLAWLRWVERRERAQLAIAVICALALPLLKLEGAVWLLLFVCVVAFGMLPRRGRRYIAAGVLAALLLGIAIDKLALPLFGLGWVGIGMHTIDVPVIGKLAVAWHGAAFKGILYSLFAQPNWHLLWWLAPAIVLWRWRELRANHSLRLLGSLLLAGIGFLAFLFLFTDAARWAESYTAINRLVMHLVPALITLLALLCRNVGVTDLQNRASCRGLQTSGRGEAAPAGYIKRQRA